MMGWMFSKSWTLKSLIRERTQNWTTKDSTDGQFKNYPDYFEAKCLKKCYKGSFFAGTLWIVWEHTTRQKSDDSVVKVERWIECDLLKCVNGQGGREWGYKDMEESSGPNVCNCPLSYLEMVPVPDSPYAKSWRESVMAYHQRRRDKRQQKKVNKSEGNYGTVNFF